MKKKKNKKVIEKEGKKLPRLILPEETKKYIFGIVAFILAAIVTLGFFEKAGIAGKVIFSGFTFLIGKTVFLLPVFLVVAGFCFFFSRYKNFLIPIILAIFLLIFGFSGILESIKPGEKTGRVPWLFDGSAFKSLWFLGDSDNSWRNHYYWRFDSLALDQAEQNSAGEKPTFAKATEERPSLIKKIFTPKFRVKEIEPSPSLGVGKKAEVLKELSLAVKPISRTEIAGGEYPSPPLELLNLQTDTPSAGDIRQNSAIIKKTLENFGIPVEMSEINTGPTVTQYTLKPADGIKLSKITTLANDLSLSLAAHPIRIEAPIPGKSLVGIEIPNKMRAAVRLRNLIATPQFHQSPSNLTIILGRDVSGNPVYADLSRMPHLLVAGSTGTGKTIFLNTLILSLLYKNSPEILRFILIDPKRVEFPVYNGLPHLLCPVIFDAQRAINALRWLTGEMERRFDVLAAQKTRDISSYNQTVVKNGEAPLPYIVLIVDELADLMAARGREVEAGIVRLAQMARAVGIHLVVATQRPSVEVITGLIKANITSRVTFQVASQVDSRTVLDMAGAEKLLGRAIFSLFRPKSSNRKEFRELMFRRRK